MPPIPSSEAPLPEPGGNSASADSLFVQPPPTPVPPGSSGIPDLLPGAADSNQPVIRKSATSSSLADLQAKIHYRQAKTRAVEEPALQQQLAFAKSQRTDPEFREEMRTYYQRLHDRIVALDSGVKESADTNLTAQLQVLAQNRFRTTSAAEIRSTRASVHR